MEHQARPKNQEPISDLEVTKHPFDTFGVAVFLVVLVEIVLLVGLNLYQKSRAEALTKELNVHQNTIASADYATINTQLEEVLAGRQTLQSALAAKVRWAQFYNMVNAVTPKNVHVATLQVNNNGTFRAEGQTTSLSSLAQALVAWQKGSGQIATPFSTVTLNANGFTSDGGRRLVTFSISGNINMGAIR